MRINSSIFLLLILSVILQGCLGLEDEKKAKNIVKAVFFEEESTLSKFINKSLDTNEKLQFALPQGANSDLVSICKRDGTVVLNNIAATESQKNEFAPFFSMVCQFKDETHATKKSLTLASLYSCMASSAGVFSGPLYSGAISKRLSTSKISDCFRTENDFFREWMNANLLNGVDSSGTVSLTKLEEVDEEQFQYHLKITINNYQGDMWFVLTKPISSFLLSHSAPSGQSLFGMTAHHSADVQHVRYDVMDLFENVEYADGSYKVLTDIRRTRSVAQIDVSSSIPTVIDSDFWSLESDTTDLIKFYSVSGGNSYGLVGSSGSLLLDESNLFTLLPPVCMNQSECIDRGSKSFSKEDLGNLGTLDNFKEQYGERIETPMPIVFNQAHLKKSPIEPKSSWSILNGSVATLKRSFSRGKLVGDYYYLTGGETFRDEAFTREEDPFRIDLTNLSIQKINSDEEAEVFGTELVAETVSKAGILENDDVIFVFGGFAENAAVATGAYIKRSTGEEVSIDAAWFEEKGFTVFPRYSPIVVWTGRYILVYGGLSLTDDLRVTSVNDGFVIELETGEAWKMNADYSPSWATEGVWSGEYLITWGGHKVNYTTLYSEVTGMNTGAVYDPSTNSWSKIIDAPIDPRLGHNLFWYDGKMTVIGGQQYLTNRDELGPSYSKNAGTFTLGAVPKIYFTEGRPRGLKENMIITANEAGEFYLEGNFGQSVVFSVYPNPGCDSTQDGVLTSSTFSTVARGKIKITQPLSFGTNVFSVELEFPEGKVCTNALTFIRN